MQELQIKPKYPEHIQKSPERSNVIPFLSIHPDFSKACDPLKEDEFEKLEQNILEFGVREPLIIWNGFIVDGHHRYKICCKNDLKFQTVEYYFEDKLSAERHIHVNQIGKRNVEPFRRIEHIKAIEEIDLKRAAKKKQGERRDIDVDPINIGQNSAQCSQKSDDYSGRVKYQLAEKAGVSHDTIHKASKIIDFGTEKLKQEVREKKKSINEGYREIKKSKMESLIGNVPDKIYRVFYSDFFEEVDCVNGWDVIHDLSFEDLKSFPMEKFREKDKNAVCFLWTSLDDFYSTLKVMNSWGFGYRTMFTLEIPRQYKGMYNIENQLVVLVGATKYECLPDLKTPLSSVLDKSLAGENRISEFRKIIDKLYTSGNKIQLFSNNKTPDWDVCDIKTQQGE